MRKHSATDTTQSASTSICGPPERRIGDWTRMRLLRRALKKARNWYTQTKAAQLKISRRIDKSRQKQAKAQSKASIHWQGKTVTGIMRDGRIDIETWQESEGVVKMRREKEKLLGATELRRALEAAEMELEASEMEEKAKSAVSLMKALEAQEESPELEEKKATEAKKLRRDMEGAEKKLEQGALETDTKWPLPTVENKTTDTSKEVATWSIRKVLEKHEAIWQEVMGGVIHGWWSRAKRHRGGMEQGQSHGARE